MMNGIWLALGLYKLMASVSIICFCFCNVIMTSCIFRLGFGTASKCTSKVKGTDVTR